MIGLAARKKARHWNTHWDKKKAEHGGLPGKAGPGSLDATYHGGHAHDILFSLKVVMVYVPQITVQPSHFSKWSQKILI
jgi:hypothetical protein